MSKETSQRLGIEGVHEVKEWLEATTRFAFTYTAYDNEAMCTVKCLNGENKTLDLVGHTTMTPKRPVSVESKKYTGPGAQGTEFKRFLAIAYSSTAQAIKDFRSDPEREFMWVTSHPFSQGDWPDLLTLTYLKKCLAENSDLLGDSEIDDELLVKVASRTWVLVVQQKQVDIRLSKDELSVVSMALTKEGLLK